MTDPKTPDEKTDEALEETFPASDAPAITPPEGSRKAERDETDPHGVGPAAEAARHEASGLPDDSRHKSETAAGAA